METDKERVTVIVKDNGVGFNTELNLKEPRTDSYGLMGMKERVEVLGGQLTISSLPHEGTAVMAMLPLE